MSAKFIAPTSHIAARLIGGEMMIMSTADSTFFTLNEVASVIWQAADGQTPLAEIVEREICSQFDVAAEVAQRDAEELVEELARHGILLISDQPIQQASRSSL